MKSLWSAWGAVDQDWEISSSLSVCPDGHCLSILVPSLLWIWNICFYIILHSSVLSLRFTWPCGLKGWSNKLQEGIKRECHISALSALQSNWLRQKAGEMAWLLLAGVTLSLTPGRVQASPWIQSIMGHEAGDHRGTVLLCGSLIEDRISSMRNSILTLEWPWWLTAKPASLPHVLGFTCKVKASLMKHACWTSDQLWLVL